MVKAVRGAISIENDTKEEIKAAIDTIVKTLEEKNGFIPDDLISIQFSVTPDIMTLNPAAALRQIRSDFCHVPLFCAQEPAYVGSLQMIIRILITFNTDNNSVYPVYLERAAFLRPDIN